jgi:hypothetical protein
MRLLEQSARQVFWGLVSRPADSFHNERSFFSLINRLTDFLCEVNLRDTTLVAFFKIRDTAFTEILRLLGRRILVRVGEALISGTMDHFYHDSIIKQPQPKLIRVFLSPDTPERIDGRASVFSIKTAKNFRISSCRKDPGAVGLSRRVLCSSLNRIWIQDALFFTRNGTREMPIRG